MKDEHKQCPGCDFYAHDSEQAHQMRCKKYESLPAVVVRADESKCGPKGKDWKHAQLA